MSQANYRRSISSLKGYTWAYSWSPEGKITWKRGRQESVIDLAFASSDVQSTLCWCGPRDYWTVISHSNTSRSYEQLVYCID